MRVVSDNTMISRGHIMSAKQQQEMDRRNSNRIPMEGSIIIYNENDYGRTTGGFKVTKRACYRIIDTHRHPLFVYAEECVRPGYFKEVILYKNDFLHKICDWVSINRVYYHCEASHIEDNLSWDELDIANFKNGYFEPEAV